MMQGTAGLSSSERSLRAAAHRLAKDGNLRVTRRELVSLCRVASSPQDKADLLNDLAVVSAVSGKIDAAKGQLRRALLALPHHGTAEKNLRSLLGDAGKRQDFQTPRTAQKRLKRIAVLSLLFNWPSTGGGTVHTKELCDALSAEGHSVCHIYAVYQPWGLGEVKGTLSVPCMPLLFEAKDWLVEHIQDRFREAVDEFAPDLVIVTDSWNSKVMLAETVGDYPYYLRLAALECVCPLNNVRLRFENHCLVQCYRSQLQEAAVCRDCVKRHDAGSGGLHQVERRLAGFEGLDYPDRLRQAFAAAEAVLVVNPEIADIVRPYCRRVEVIPSGFDENRFVDGVSTEHRGEECAITRFIFAGLIDEPMKGFAVLLEAAQQLAATRRDFELIVTAGQPEGIDLPFIRWIGWQSQSDLPKAIRSADVLIFPTIAQEALGRTAVEAMACGRAVIASRLGGLEWVVEDEITGLLVVPGDSADLAAKMVRLMEDSPLREKMGAAGRAKFVENFTWSAIIDKHYRPLIDQLM